MAQHIIFANAEGGCTVLFISKNATLTMEERIRKFVPPGALYTIQNADDTPSDRTFRGAWRYEDGKVVCDLDHAKEIARSNVRVARKPVLEALDIEAMKQIELGIVHPVGDNPVVQKKNIARDATDDSRIVDATTVAELKDAMTRVMADVETLAA